jgi:hypothetical protein
MSVTARYPAAYPRLVSARLIRHATIWQIAPAQWPASTLGIKLRRPGLETSRHAAAIVAGALRR